MSDALDGGALFDALAECRVRYVVIGGFAVIAHAVVRSFRGGDVAVASLESLRLMKRAAARPQDLEDLGRLDLAHGRGEADGSRP